MAKKGAVRGGRHVEKSAAKGTAFAGYSTKALTFAASAALALVAAILYAAFLGPRGPLASALEEAAAGDQAALVAHFADLASIDVCADVHAVAAEIARRCGKAYDCQLYDTAVQALLPLLALLPWAKTWLRRSRTLALLRKIQDAANWGVDWQIQQRQAYIFVGLDLHEWLNGTSPEEEAPHDTSTETCRKALTAKRATDVEVLTTVIDAARNFQAYTIKLFGRTSVQASATDAVSELMQRLLFCECAQGVCNLVQGFFADELLPVVQSVLSPKAELQLVDTWVFREHTPQELPQSLLQAANVTGSSWLYQSVKNGTLQSWQVLMRLSAKKENLRDAIARQLHKLPLPAWIVRLPSQSTACWRVYLALESRSGTNEMSEAFIRQPYGPFQCGSEAKIDKALLATSRAPSEKTVDQLRPLVKKLVGQLARGGWTPRSRLDVHLMALDLVEDAASGSWKVLPFGTRMEKTKSAEHHSSQFAATALNELLFLQGLLTDASVSARDREASAALLGCGRSSAPDRIHSMWTPLGVQQHQGIWRPADGSKDALSAAISCSDGIKIRFKLDFGNVAAWHGYMERTLEQLPDCFVWTKTGKGKDSEAFDTTQNFFVNGLTGFQDIDPERLLVLDMYAVWELTSKKKIRGYFPPNAPWFKSGLRHSPALNVEEMLPMLNADADNETQDEGAEPAIFVKEERTQASKGTFVFANSSELDKFLRPHGPGGKMRDGKWMLQLEVKPPLLSAGRKFDIRFFVLLVSAPTKLRIKRGEHDKVDGATAKDADGSSFAAFLYRDGYAKLAPLPYLSGATDKARQLANARDDFRSLRKDGEGTGPRRWLQLEDLIGDPLEASELDVVKDKMREGLSELLQRAVKLNRLRGDSDYKNLRLLRADAMLDATQRAAEPWLFELNAGPGFVVEEEGLVDSIYRPMLTSLALDFARPLLLRNEVHPNADKWDVLPLRT
eukprot:TRINITY_DN47207_c0_g1_i1.p1 TRINITY_DN47207_c0_g1~~TRINITY_DN47207_c0_g1_i1.p1  ORF type:complete len:956 (-),score=186.76 TRINITY_DN47207_c0_g1_i1:30-2897(-)